MEWVGRITNSDISCFFIYFIINLALKGLNTVPMSVYTKGSQLANNLTQSQSKVPCENSVDDIGVDSFTQIPTQTQSQTQPSLQCGQGSLPKMVDSDGEDSDDEEEPVEEGDLLENFLGKETQPLSAGSKPGVSGRVKKKSA